MRGSIIGVVVRFVVAAGEAGAVFGKFGVEVDLRLKVLD